MAHGLMEFVNEIRSAEFKDSSMYLEEMVMQIG